MKKVPVFIGSVLLAASLGLSTVSAKDLVFGAPAGFNNQAPNTVQGVKSNAYDDQMVTLVGRLTRYLGEEHYEFADNTGTIEVELDDDMNWSHIAKDQLIRIYGEVDKDLLSTTINVQYAQPVEPVKK